MLLSQTATNALPMARSGAVINRVTATAYTIPTDQPESDGTLAWDRTTMVITELEAASTRAIGYTYASHVAAALIVEVLAQDLLGGDPFDHARLTAALSRRLRNIGRPGIGATAVSALDQALWDLKSRMLGLSLVDLLGSVRDEAAAYGSGGFTSYSNSHLSEQLGGWAAEGFDMVKMKIGRNPEVDPDRIREARSAIGDSVQLFVDANGAFDERGALAASRWLDESSVTWFEEPVTSDDIGGLRFVRERVPRSMPVAAGEYGWTPIDFVRLVDGAAVDVLQADATRCLGISGFLDAVAICAARALPMSTHCAPTIHSKLACVAEPVRHIEWFHDHVRIERRFFDGFCDAKDGVVRPDRGRPGIGIELRRTDLEPYLVWYGEMTL